MTSQIELVIQTNVSFNKEEQVLLNNFKELWQKMHVENTGNKFVLQLALSEKQAISKEQVVISTIDKHTLQILSPTTKGLLHGMYTWLEQVGFRFYGPGEEWLYIPKDVKQEDLTIDLVSQPKFSLRYFFSGRGFGQKKYPKMQEVKRDWDRWYQQLRLGNPDEMNFGHYGSAFNRKHKKQIEKHPEWRTMLNGRRQPWSGGMKLCYSNKEVQNLYIQDAIARLKQMKTEGVSPPYYINMEPPDGKDFCECDQCRSQANKLSDNIFRLANFVARALKIEEPKARVFLLGYNTHALPPSFSLEENVYVVIAPDFSVYPPSPAEEVVAAWQKAHPGHLFYRGYLAIPMWNHDLPLLEKEKNKYKNILEVIANEGFLGYNFGTSYAYGAVGWFQYVIAHKSWDASFDVEQAREEFYQKMFPGHEEEISEFYKYLQKTAKNSLYIPPAKKILTTILQDPNVDDFYRERITNLYQYLDYIAAYHSWENNPSKTTKSTLVEQIGNMYQTKMVNTFALYKLLELEKKIATASLSLKQKGNVDANIVSRAMNTTKSLLGLPPTKKMTPLFPEWQDETEPETAVKFRNDVDAVLYARSANQRVHFRVRSRILRQYKNGWGRLELRTKSGGLIESVSLKQTGEWENYTVTLPTNGMYNLWIRQAATEVELVPPAIPFAFETPLINQKRSKGWQLFYFNVPQKVASVYVHLPARSGYVSFIDPSGTEIKIAVGEKDKRVRLMTAGKSGQWKMKTHKAGFELINIPHLISVSPNAVMQ